MLDVRMETKTFPVELQTKLCASGTSKSPACEKYPRMMASKKNQRVEKIMTTDNTLQDFREFLDVTVASSALADRVDTLLHENIIRMEKNEEVFGM